jgi:hypothetical protein
MISFRIIALTLVCLVTLRENFSFALTVISPSATFHAIFSENDQATEEDDSDLPPDQLPADDSDLPAVVELELSQSNLSLSEHASTLGETQIGFCLEAPSLAYERADSLSGTLDGLNALLRMRI